jgi:hypothetical protein
MVLLWSSKKAQFLNFITEKLGFFSNISIQENANAHGPFRVSSWNVTANDKNP